MLHGHACTLVRARSALAALADQAPTVDASSAFELALVELDRLHGDLSPNVDAHDLLSEIPDEFAALLIEATCALEELELYGVDPLSIELILAVFDDAPEAPTAPNGSAQGGS